MSHAVRNALNLSDSEKAVLAVLETHQLAQNVSKIARKAGVPRTTADYTLRKFEKWKIAKQVRTGKRCYWMFNKMFG